MFPEELAQSEGLWIGALTATATLLGAIVGARVQHNLAVRNQHHEDLIVHYLNPWHQDIHHQIGTADYPHLLPKPQAQADPTAIEWQNHAHAHPRNDSGDQYARSALKDDVVAHWPRLAESEKEFLKRWNHVNSEAKRLGLELLSAVQDIYKDFPPSDAIIWRDEANATAVVLTKLVLAEGPPEQRKPRFNGSISLLPGGGGKYYVAASVSLCDCSSPDAAHEIKRRLEEAALKAWKGDALRQLFNQSNMLWAQLKSHRTQIEGAIARRHFSGHCPDCNRTIFWYGNWVRRTLATLETRFRRKTRQTLGD